MYFFFNFPLIVFRRKQQQLQELQHFVGDPPTDLALHKNSPGYRLILNNILFPAAKKKKQKAIKQAEGIAIDGGRLLVACDSRSSIYEFRIE